MLNLSKKAFESFKGKLQQSSALWELVQTKNNSYISVGGKGKFYETETGSNKGKMSIKELSAISIVSSELKKFAPTLLSHEKDYTKIDLFNKYSYKAREGYFEDYIQIDINSAYLSALKNAGAISQKTYDLFFEVEDLKKITPRKLAFKSENKDYKSRSGGILRLSKRCRLIAVGAIASRKNITFYKGAEKINTDEKYNKEWANVFFYGAYLVGKVMSEILEKCKGLFYWVDCIFAPKNQYDEIVQILERNGFEYHFEDIEIAVKKEKHNVVFTTIKKESGEMIDYRFRYSKCLDFSKFQNDSHAILAIYEQIQNGAIEKIKTIELLRELKKIGLQVVDLLKIKKSYIALDVIQDNEILQAIFLATKNDIGIMFEHYNNEA